ncbi:MAG: hypothetical protein WCS52_02230 [bacterium]
MSSKTINLESGKSKHRNKTVIKRMMTQIHSHFAAELNKAQRSESNVLFVQSIDGTVANRKYYRLNTKRSVRVPAALEVMSRTDVPSQPRNAIGGQETMIPIDRGQAQSLMTHGYVVCDPACHNLRLPYPSKFGICPLHPQEVCLHPVVGALASYLLSRPGNQKAVSLSSSRKSTVKASVKKVKKGNK